MSIILIIGWLAIGFLSSMLWIYTLAKDEGEVELRAILCGVPIGTILGLVTLYFACDALNLFDTDLEGKEMNFLRLITILVIVLMIGFTVAYAQDFKDYTPTGETTVQTANGDKVVKFGVNLKDIDRTGKTYTKFFGLRYLDDNNFLIDLISTDCVDKYSILGSAGKVQGKDTLNRPDSPEILVAKPKTQIARAIVMVCGEHI